MLKLIDKVVSLFPKPLRDLYYKHEDLMLYLIFGVLTTIVSFVTQYGMSIILSQTAMLEEVRLLIDTIFSWICSVTFAFFTNKKYVFKSVTNNKKDFWNEFLKFYSARLASLGLEAIIILVFVTTLHFSEMIVKIFAQILIMLANYLFSKLVVFKGKQKD
ncbi:MAG: GtrA family protein [Ruminococcus sp.]|nr:GtrA family protein [Ruminococcus sp.]MCD7799693.1 GtrA family protein [Ruminococcus sp.]